MELTTTPWSPSLSSLLQNSTLSTGLESLRILPTGSRRANAAHLRRIHVRVPTAAEMEGVERRTHPRSASRESR